MQTCKKNYYRKKRQQLGLSRSEVANALGIDCKRYDLIDKGEVKMPKNLINKFNEIINKTRGEQTIDKVNREQLVNDWWNKMSVKTGPGEYMLSEKMKEFNIASYKELAVLLGWKTGSGLISYLTGVHKISFNTKNRIYSFFENELNIQPIKKSKDIPKNTVLARYAEWYKSFDINEWLHKNNLAQSDIVKYTDLSTGTVSNICCGKFDMPKISTLVQLKEFVDNIENDTTIVPDTQSEKTFELTSIPLENVPDDIKEIGQNIVKEVNDNMQLKEKLVDTYRNKLEGLEETIKNRKQELLELEIQKNVYEELLESI